jgi:hypothetical protein
MLLYKCLECNTKTINFYYIKKHKHKSIQMYCLLCNNIFLNNHYSYCPYITLLYLDVLSD